MDVTHVSQRSRRGRRRVLRATMRVTDGEANPGPFRQSRPCHGAPPESPPPTRRRARLQAMGSREGHRRGLVVEVAPIVVDAIAVALPSSPHVITDVLESNLPVCDAGLLAQSARVQSMPVFDPLESDEEDELDALSRNVTGVPAVGHADLQGPTQVDSDDEPMVSVLPLRGSSTPKDRLEQDVLEGG